jgi:hypothetical protein
MIRALILETAFALSVSATSIAGPDPPEQAHRRWLTVWLSTVPKASAEDAAAYARVSVAAEDAASL